MTNNEAFSVKWSGVSKLLATSQPSDSSKGSLTFIELREEGQAPRSKTSQVPYSTINYKLYFLKSVLFELIFFILR